ncbi:Retrovirus-related Pol polyprotein from transposon TNT 1-94 [Vitis vinifera]|uniref:Retrovirus-related Pol polyprotein from transposon TNT 1-94 n=1 Tax=Vitis vinifera TaxID=29760 RepID=A0A438CYB8_VITVI|nr:Retrovirus-related Pol polyprotein from transposon TNT 1-94 [Vitis vinifera]
MTRKTMMNRGFEPWAFRSCLGYQHFVINDNNRDQRKKDSKKTATATIAEIKTEANVAEKASALVAATDHGANGNTTPVIGEGSLTLTDTLNLDSVLVVPSLDYNLCQFLKSPQPYLSNDSNKLQQALMADGSEGEKKKMTWLCLMKTKDEVNLLFQKFHKMIETQYNAKVRVLRSDNGGEYQSSDLQKYLEGHGIIHQTTCSNTPQQNGVAEQKNRHLLEVVRASLIAAKTPISYWGEAITSAAYLINRVPSSSINFQTPLQALTNAVVAPTVPNLPPRVFGCVAFVHLHKHQRTKLTSHALQCVFVGYALHKKGYRCYHPPTRQMYITMDVVFYEDSLNQEAGELDMSGQQFGSEDVFTEIPNQSSSVEGILNLEPDPFMKRLPHRHNRGKKPVGCRWIYTVKYKADGSIERFKARLVAKWYTQTYGIDYTETFAPVAKINTVRVLLSLAANLDWPFTTVRCEKCLSACHCMGEAIPESMVWKVHKVNETFGYRQRNDPEERKALQNYLSRKFEMKDLDLLQETGMSGCQPVNTPIEEGLKLCVEPNQVSTDKGIYQRLVGRLMYLAHIRPDLAYALSVSIEVYTDADWAGALDDRRSTSGYFTFVGGNLVTWKSKKQNVVARSSAEVEFRGMALGLCEALWLRLLLQDLGYLSRQPILLFCDNKAACDIAHNPVHHDRTKHVEVDRFFIKEKLDDKIVELPKIRSEDPLADIFTKAVSSQLILPSVQISGSHVELEDWSSGELSACDTCKEEIRAAARRRALGRLGKEDFGERSSSLLRRRAERDIEESFWLVRETMPFGGGCGKILRVRYFLRGKIFFWCGFPLLGEKRYFREVFGDRWKLNRTSTLSGMKAAGH